jgi:regulatory protein
MGDINLYNIALKKSMALCAGREMCCSDIRNKLNTWDVSERDADRIIEQLCHDRFIDEDRYALAFVKDKFRYNKWGKIKISYSLQRKKIPETSIRKALESIDDELYLSVLRDILANHRRTIKAKNQYDLKGKLLRFGLSKGFESNYIYEIINEI